MSRLRNLGARRRTAPPLLGLLLTALLLLLAVTAYEAFSGRSLASMFMPGAPHTRLCSPQVSQALSALTVLFTKLRHSQGRQLLLR